MNLEPVIKTRFQRFRDTFELNTMQDSVAFEQFVNHAVLSSHQPDAFSADTSLLESVSVGGANDMGIDGLAIKLNGLLVSTIQDVADIAEKFQRVTVEFLFVQTKMGPKFDSGEFTKFTAGVRDFLNEDHKQVSNEKLQPLFDVKDNLLSDDVVVMWENNPSVRLYYVALGRWRNSHHLVAHADQFKSDIGDISTYGDCNVHFVDAEALKAICDNNENTFTATIEAIDTMPLTEVEGVTNSCLALCHAGEFLKLLSTEEGVIR